MTEDCGKWLASVAMAAVFLPKAVVAETTVVGCSIEPASGLLESFFEKSAIRRAVNASPERAKLQPLFNATERAIAEKREDREQLVSAFYREFCRANPALQSADILFVRRSHSGCNGELFPWQCDASLPAESAGDSIFRASLIPGKNEPQELYSTKFIATGLAVSPDVSRAYFSMTGDDGHRGVFSIALDGEVSPKRHSPVGKDWFSPCPLPDGSLAAIATAVKSGFSEDMYGALYRLAEGEEPSRLTFDNSGNWSPRLQNGRIFFQRGNNADRPAEFERQWWSVAQDGTDLRQALAPKPPDFSLFSTNGIIAITDSFGNTIPLWQDKDAWLVEPLLVRSSATDAPLKTPRDVTAPATLMLANVPQFFDLQDAPGNAVKTIRVAGVAPSRRIGKVEVPQDGAVKIVLPPQTQFILQALDVQGRLVAEPKEAALQKGEQARFGEEPAKIARKAVRWWNGDKGISFRGDIFPIVYRNCAYCHTPQATRLNVLGEKIANLASEGDAFETLANVAHDLPDLLRMHHSGTELTAKEMETLCAWAELGAPRNDEDVLPQPFPPIKVPAPFVCTNKVDLSGWPQLSVQTTNQPRQVLKFAVGNTFLSFVQIPDGEFAMGSYDGLDRTAPPCRVKLDRSFWISRTEITCEQMWSFDNSFDRTSQKPACGVSWLKANAYCEWLGRKFKRVFALPTEAQWEWTCRAGSSAAIVLPERRDHWQIFANIAPASDGLRSVGWLLPNKQGVCDMHGNAAEWTRSSYLPYPYDENDGRNEPGASVVKTIRGGSWRSLATAACAANRRGLPAWSRRNDVGFRVVIED